MNQNKLELTPNIRILLQSTHDHVVVILGVGVAKIPLQDYQC